MFFNVPHKFKTQVNTFFKNLYVSGKTNFIDLRKKASTKFCSASSYSKYKCTKKKTRHTVVDILQNIFSTTFYILLNRWVTDSTISKNNKISYHITWQFFDRKTGATLTKFTKQFYIIQKDFNPSLVLSLLNPNSWYWALPVIYIKKNKSFS